VRGGRPPIRHLRRLRIAAGACLALGLAATVWSVTELQGGVTELPSHWWSSAAAGLLVLGAAATLAAWRLPRADGRHAG
jgi:hypothetical protein